MIILFSKHNKKISSVTLFAILLQLFYPLNTFALTGGPSQPEYESFEPAGASEMVNLASGDFVYNIPLMDIDGYPINIAYHGGVNMEQEASWVGLGWSLNPGSINRGMRGLPDDFNGSSDKITTTIKVKDNKTFGLGVGGGAEVAGFDFASIGASAGFGIQYNTYKGLGLSVEIGVTGQLEATSMGQGAKASGGLGLKVSNQDGVDFTMSGGLGVQASMSFAGVGVGGALGVNRTKSNNSRRGIEADIVSGSSGIGGGIMGVGFSTGTGSSINLIPNTAYTPNMEFPTKFSGITGEVKMGGSLYWVSLQGYTRGYVFSQGIDGEEFDREAFGYLNMDNANSTSMMDFNRDNDGVYNLECPKLPFSNATYDLFNSNAQGLNEVFRPYRNEVGCVYDNSTTSSGFANDIGLEGSYGNLLQLGFNNYGVTTNASSGAWTNTNGAFNNGIRFQGNDQLQNSGGSNTQEPVYFKALDEFPLEEQSYNDLILGKNTASFKLDPVEGTSVAYLLNKITDASGNISTISNGIKKANREPRNNNFSFLTADDASLFGLDKNISSYTMNNFNYTTNGDINESVYSHTSRTNNIPSNHISEISVLKEDGARYIYGVPIYNSKQKEVVFNASSLTPNNNTGTVDYTAQDASTSNSKGIDNLYFSKEVSPYAHTYLLTALLSKDYVDITGNGLSSDDYGDYTKFNYSKASSNYKWRNPCSNTVNQALFEPQWRSDPNDDKGIYIYGEKELWYPHSIETKNYVAEFYTSARDDARGVIGGVAGENGSADGTNSNNIAYKLDKIVLYSKKDRTTPIKTVNFKYSYTLCPQTPNSFTSANNPNKGKLTLEKIYFTYGKSDKGVFSPYVFKYADFNEDGSIDAGCNPSYNRTEMDRWGCYKINETAPLSNRDFPYTNQDKIKADKNASVWLLSSIVTPAQSRIDVTYESDDYAYIQNQVPGQMIKMVDFVSSKPATSAIINKQFPSTHSSNLFATSGSYSPNNYMIVDLSGMKDGGILANSLSDAEVILKQKALPQDDKLYFKAFVQLGGDASTKDFISGYTGIDYNESGILTDGSTVIGSSTLYKYAFIKLDDIDIEDPNSSPGDNCNPISKAAWQTTRMYQPRIAYPGSEPGSSTLSACMGLISSLAEVFSFSEKNNRLRKKSFSAIIEPAQSFVRLNIPTKTKFGGGHRVSKIEITDNWNSMVSNEATTTYGQTYDYTINDNGQTISSGVASYEPLAGGDEISLRKPYEYSVKRVAAPNDAHFFEYPLGEAFFPPPTIIYSKVTVRNLDRLSGNTTVTSNIGRTEYEFFTSKDFPIFSEMDGLQSYIHTPDPYGDLFNKTIENAVYLSQGFTLKLNNMHGKLKSVLSYQEGNNSPISGVRYFYKTNTSGELENNLPVIDETGLVSTKIVGQHTEAVADFRAQNSTSFANTLSGDVDVSIVGIYPIPIPSIYWGSSSETRDFYSATFNKVITQHGVLEKVETISNYASSISENLIWDAKTTDVVLARTSTNFRDYDYSYSTPAHWVYKGMGAAYQNIGLGFKNPIPLPLTNLNAGVISGVSGLLNPGDEIQLIGTNSSNVKLGVYPHRLWVSKDASNNLVFIDRSGKICNKSGNANTIDVFTISGAANYVAKVIRSGYRNILDETAETISFSANPSVSNSINLNNNVLDASASEFSEDWQSFCSSIATDACLPANPESYCQSYTLTTSTNPYILNTKGNWNEKRNYQYLSNRLSKNQTNQNMDIRKDGTFEIYKPFFSYFNSSWKEVYNPLRTSDYSASVPYSNWILSSELTKVTSYGNEVEAKDALNRYSSSLYGYNQTYKTAIAANAKYREVGCDNFEDYSYYNCTDNHFNFKQSYTKLVNTTAHTGRYSMKVEPLGCVSLSKQILAPDEDIYFGSNNTSQNTTPRSQNTKGYYPSTCIPDFSPESNLIVSQKYVLSFWAKESSINQNADYTSIFADVMLNGSSISSLVKKSVIINGWQKYDYEFIIPANTTAGNTLLFRINNTGNSIIYFDDIRVQPYNATLGTYVYDPKSLRLWAELDERNFATFYEYDNEGVLVRVKKETENGIQTIKETRNSFKKQ